MFNGKQYGLQVLLNNIQLTLNDIQPLLDHIYFLFDHLELFVHKIESLCFKSVLENDLVRGNH
jgi:hypothetical protein